jgi:AAA+ superfamily predicted ATPase
MMDKNEVTRLRKQDRFADIAAMTDREEPAQVADIDIILVAAEAYRETRQYSKSIKWYMRALEAGTNEDVVTPLSELYRLTWQKGEAWSVLYDRVSGLEIPDNQKLVLKYEKLLGEKWPEERLIEVLSSYVEEELFDLHLIELAELYIKNNEETGGKKLLKKCIRFSSVDEYVSHAKLLLEAIEQGHALETVKAEPIRKKIYGQEKNEEAVSKIDEDGSRNLSLTELHGKRKKKNNVKKKIITSIQDLFKNVVGMEAVKEELQSFYNVLQFQNSRVNQGMDYEILKTNFIITGERGSGKTLVTHLISSMMEMFGITYDDSITEVTAREVEEAHSKGGTKGLLELFSNIKETVAVIDNIDRLFDDSEQDKKMVPLAEAIAELMKERRDSLALILTGSKSSMEAFINEDIANLVYGRLEIPMYTANELLQLINHLAEMRQFHISNSASKMLLKRIQMARNMKNFFNAITLNTILDEAIKHMADRYMAGYSEEREAMYVIEEEDFDTGSGDEESIDELLKKLDSLTGLQSVKRDVRSKIETIIAQQNAMDLGSKRSSDFGTLHMVFKGSPGTGKTTVARIIGKIYQQLGVLPRGNVFVECTRKDLVGEYQGHTATKTHNKFKEALGGVLFIDEAYSLVQGDGDAYGNEALDTLIADIENYRDSIMVILAGYSDDMKEFLLHNPGMSSRIPNEIVFEDYTIDDMAEIFAYMVRDNGMILDRNTSYSLRQLIEEKSRVRDFGNARGVRNLVDRVRKAMDQRLVQMQFQSGMLGKNDYEIITSKDIEAVMSQKTEKEKSLDDLMEELNALTGLSSVKHQVKQMVAMIKLKKKSEELKLGTTGSLGSLHLVFKGNAGTGKTTIARILGQIYEKLGVLPRGNVFVECSRAGLIGQYQGHTTKKVEEKVKEAEGGILFIDEAYDLCHGENDDFGKEIVSTLLKAIEDKRDHLMVIMAGYGDKMENFFKTNQGLKSRMANEIYFEDYALDELVEIFYYMASSNNLRIEDGLEDFIKRYIEKKMQGIEDFGNARGVRNIYEEVFRKRALRLSEIIDSGHLNPEQFVTIIKKEFE